MTKIISNEEAQAAQKVVRVHLHLKGNVSLNLESGLSVVDTRVFLTHAIRNEKSLISFKDGAVLSDEIRAFQVYEREADK